MEGYISLHRDIKSHWVWEEKPFSRGQAWIDLLLQANHQDAKFPLGKEIVEVKRGSFITSEVKLMERWGWSNTKVRNFLLLLENDNMIIKKTDRKKSTLTICNYNVWQDSEKCKKSEKKVKKNTNNNVNNENKKTIYGKFVSMTEEEYQKLCERFGEQNTKDMIERMEIYCGSNGKTYTDYYLTAIGWFKRDEDKRKNNVVHMQPQYKEKQYNRIIVD